MINTNANAVREPTPGCVLRREDSQEAQTELQDHYWSSCQRSEGSSYRQEKRRPLAPGWPSVSGNLMDRGSPSFESQIAIAPSAVNRAPNVHDQVAPLAIRNSLLAMRKNSSKSSK